MRKALLVTLVLVGSLMAFAQADMPKPTYDFSLSREGKVKLAESAAPPEVSGKAAVYLLERTGYVKARDGTNGFSCFVDRQTPWNCEPTCFDAEGTATTLPTRLVVEEERAKGKTEDQIKTEIDEGYTSGRFRAPSKPGIVYMMSDSIFLLVSGNRIVHVPRKVFDISYLTARSDLKKLEAAGIVQQLSNIEQITYYCGPIYQAPFEEIEEG